MDEKTKNLVEEFLLKSEAKGEISDSTVVKYRSLLLYFFKLMGKSIFNLTAGDFDNFIVQKKNYEEKPVLATTLRNYAFALRKFVAYLKKNGVDLKIGASDIEIPKDKRKRKPVYLTDEEVLRFLAAISEDGTELRVVRFYTLVQLLLDSGSRISEALSVKVKDIDWEKRTVDIVGKNDKERTLMFGSEAEQWLKRYLARRKSDNEYLFTTIDGKRQWKKFEIDDLFRRYAKKAGITKQTTAHAMRRTCATRMLRRGLKINDVSYLLGHADSQTTLKYYIGVPTTDELREKITDDYYKFAPESELKRLGFQNKAGLAGAGDANDDLPHCPKW
ncbi:MAG: tyrosine-type recombinase/integrase [Parcubacteria group bacterium]|jgi:integrase/recombinase XerD